MGNVKIAVSVSMDPALKAEIDQAISNALVRGDETDFSKWMRDAARRKLKLNLPVYRKPTFDARLEREDDAAIKPYGDKKIVPLGEKRAQRKVSYSSPKKQVRR